MPADVELYYQEWQGRTRLTEEWMTLLEEVSLWRPPMYTGDEERVRDRGGRTQVLLSRSTTIKRYTSVENLDYDEHWGSGALGTSTADPSSDASSSSSAEAEAEAEADVVDPMVEEGADEEEEELAEVNFAYCRLKVKCGSGASCPQTRNLKDALLEAAQSSMDEFERAWEALVTHFTTRGLKDVKMQTDVRSMEREAQERKLSVVELITEIETSSRATYQRRILRESIICISAFQAVARMLVPKQKSCALILASPSPPIGPLSRFPTALSEPSDFYSVPSNS